MGDHPKRKTARRASAHYYITAEEHVDNEVKHERLLTETSKISSSWSSLRVSRSRPAERQLSDEACCSSASSANSSPVVHRPSSFSGPLVISVTCSNSTASPNFNYTVPLSPTQTAVTSCHPSPCASPVSSRVQCYSPGVGVKPYAGKRTSLCYQNGGASPLLVSAAQKRKRAIPWTSVSGSSAEHSRESSPDPAPKLQKQLDNLDINSFRWPPTSPGSSNHFANAPSSPSTMSLPSPRLSVSSASNHNPNSPAFQLNNNHHSNNIQMQSDSGLASSTPSAKSTLLNLSSDSSSADLTLRHKQLMDEDSNSMISLSSHEEAI